MEEILKEYIAYYEARMKRFEGNPLYPNSFNSEKALYDAIASCEKLEDFKDKESSGNLSVKNAVALVKDQAAAELEHYTELKEAVRAKAPEETLQVIDKAQTALDVANIASDVETKWSKEIAVDLFTDAFYDSYLSHLEHIEVLQKAVVPDQWKKEQEQSLADEIQSFKESLASDRENNGAWQSGWRLNTDSLWEDRHRRKVPLPDDSLKRRISEYDQHAD